MSHPHTYHQLAARFLLLVALLAPMPGLAQDVNSAHPLARGLVGWWLVTPPLAGGGAWWNLLQRYHGLLVNMGSGSGWQSTSRTGWSGEMRFDGSDDVVSLGALPVWAFNDTTFTVALRFRAPVAASSYLLATRNSGTFSGGYFIRLDGAGASGTITARILANAAGNVVQRTTSVTSYANGNWHSVVVVFRTDTATAANNDVVIFGDGVNDAGSFTAPSTLVYEACITFNPTCALTLGATVDGVGPLLGALDDIRIWQRGLSAAEALAYHRETLVDMQARDFDYPWLGTLTPSVRRRVVIE